MYPITNAVKALFDNENRQVLRITGIDKNGTPITITEKNVMEGGFNVDRYACNGERLEIGSAVAAELTLKLDNRYGTFTNTLFEGTELYVEIGIADWTQSDPVVYYIPCGYFTPDEQPRALSTITLHALDRMMVFDKELDPVGDPSKWVDASGNYIVDKDSNNIIFYPPVSDFPCTVESLVKQCCDLFGVILGDSLTGKPNASYVVNSIQASQNAVTYRNVIQWCAALMGTNAYIDWEGKLRFAWYDNATGYVTTPANRFSSTVHENDISISGITYTDENEDVHLSGSEYYALDLTGNLLIDSTTADTALAALYSALHAFTYRPFTASVVSAPYLWPMDRVVFTDKDGTTHISSLTNVNITVNGSTAIAGKGETDRQNSYAKPGAFTGRQANALKKIINETNNNLNEAVENATALITGANGGHVRFIYDANNELSEIVIMDTTSTDTATKVWRWNSGGLGYSSNGYNGPYTLAITQDGAIVANFITTGTLDAQLATIVHLDASNISAGTLSADRIGSGSITSAKIASNTITTSNLADTIKGNVTTDTALIYRSAVSGTTSMAKPDYYISDTTGNQNTWTLKRPQYSASYPVLFVAQQEQTLDGEISFTTPQIDLTTTVIDGGHITTGTIDAGVVNVTHLNGSNLTSGTINGNNVNAKQISILDANNNTIATFDSTIRIGNQQKIHSETTFGKYALYTDPTNQIYSVEILNNAEGLATVREYFYGDGSTTDFILRYHVAVGERTHDDVTYEDEPLIDVSVNSVQIPWWSQTQYTVTDVNKDNTGDIVISALTFSTAPGSDKSIYVEYTTDTIVCSYVNGVKKENTTLGMYSAIYGYGCEASGDFSIAEGLQTRAIGLCSHAEGGPEYNDITQVDIYAPEAHGDFSHASGCGTVAEAIGSCAEGYQTYAGGKYSHAMGVGCMSDEIGSLVLGEYNASSTGCYLVVGNGNSSNRSDAMYVETNGDMYIAGTLYQNSDERYKSKYGEIPDVSAIRARSFKWNDKKPHADDKTHYGYYAQDVEAVAPDLITTDANGFKSLDYIGFLCAKVHCLEKRLAEMESLLRKGNNNGGDE